MKLVNIHGPLMSTRLRDNPDMGPILKDSHFPWDAETVYSVYIVTVITAYIYCLCAMW